MIKAPQIIGQSVFYGLFIAATGYLSASPAYQVIEPDMALVKISMAHTSKPAGKCITQTPEQLEKLPPNMRLPVVCPRERSPLYLEVELDGKMIYQESILPAGINHDSACYNYHKIKVPAGSYNLKTRMRDSILTEGFDYTAERNVELAASDILVIDFDSKHQEFIFE